MEKTNSRKEITKITVYLPKGIHKLFKVLCVQNEVSMSEKVIALIEGFVNSVNLSEKSLTFPYSSPQPEQNEDNIKPILTHKEKKLKHELENSDKEFYTLKDITVLNNIPESTLRAHCKSGILNAEKDYLTKRWRVSKENKESYLRGRNRA